MCVFLGSHRVSAQEFPSLFNACDIAKVFRPLLEQSAPESACLDFIRSCDDPPEIIDTVYWRNRWAKHFRAPYAGECPGDTFPSVLGADPSEIMRSDDLMFTEGNPITSPTAFGDVEGIPFSFSSQVWKCFRLFHYGVFVVPKNRFNPRFGIILNGGANPPEGPLPDPKPFLDKHAALAGELGVVIMEITTDQPPRKFVRDGYLWDMHRVVTELSVPTLRNLCSIFSALFVPYVTTDAHMVSQDPSYDFRTPMGITLRRAMTLMGWRFGIEKVVMSGGSQWGISLYLPAAVDSRVAGFHSTGMHALFDMRKYMEYVYRSGFTYGFRLLTPTLAREFLLGMEIYPKFNDLSPVGLSFSAPILLTGGSGDEFYPIEGFTLFPQVSSPAKYTFVESNIGHGFEGPKTHGTKRAFFRNIITGSPSFTSTVEIVSEDASGEDWIVEALISSGEPISSVSLWWACDEKNDGSFNDDTWRETRGSPAPGLQRFVISGGNTCRYLSYFAEIGFAPAPDALWMSSLPRFPKGSPALTPRKGMSGAGPGCSVAPSGSRGYGALIFFIVVMAALAALRKVGNR